MKTFLVITLGFISNVCSAQIVEHFNDGEFTSSPPWSGDAAHFIVNSSQQLQLNNTISATSYLSTVFESSSLDGYEWEVYVKQTFSSSGSNYSRIYLVSDQSNVTGSLNGYYLQMGEAGSNDAVELFRQSGTVRTSVCRAINGKIAGSFAVRVRVTRDDDGLWTLLIDYTGGTSFVEEAHGLDSTFNTSEYFGVVCVYTAGNANKFFFDDVLAGPPLGDITPPVLNGLTINSQSEVTLDFSESLDTSATDVVNFNASDGLSSPALAVLLAGEKSIKLTFSESFVNGKLYQLSITGVRDLAGNHMLPVETTFRHFVPQPASISDLVFNELFTDPSPVIGLPAHEFVEIFNRSEKAFDLVNWRLNDLTSSTTLPSMFILPGEHLILTTSAAIQHYQQYGITLALADMPTLNNSSDSFVLKDGDGRTVDSVRYELSWFHDDDKQQGGYTLERLDPLGETNEPLYWMASMDSKGGTPGAPNSVLGKNPDSEPPKIDSLIVVDKNRLKLVFSEPMDSISIQALSSYHVGDKLPSDVFQTSAHSALLQFLNDFENGVENILKVNAVADVAGNVIIADSLRFMYFKSNTPIRGCLLINEIMFDPAPVVQLPEAEFIEIMNTSAFPYDLGGWTISDATSTTVLPTVIVLPGQHLVLTSTGNAFKFQPTRAIGVTGFPSLNNTGEPIVIKSPDGGVIDSINYDLAWLGSDVKRDGGWSLERLRHNYSSTESINWRPSIDHRGGTPGEQNSLFGKNPDEQPPRILSALAQSNELVLINFSEPVNPVPGDRYFKVDSTFCNEVEWITTTEARCRLAVPLVNGRAYTLSVWGLLDTAINAMPHTELMIRHFIPSPVKPKDVMINEIMADPTPSVGLPESEYVELYNRSQNAVSLLGWQLSDANSSTVLPDMIIQPNEFLLLTSSVHDDFPVRENLLILSSLPSLSNEGEHLVLRTPDRVQVDSINYDPQLFGDSEKKDGGWSMELIDPQNLCGEQENWAASEDESGGTPGRENSVRANKPDLTGPQLMNVIVESSRSLLAVFDEKLDRLLSSKSFTLSPPAGSLSVAFVDISLRTVRLTLDEDIKLSTPYRLELTDLYDCNGNSIEDLHRLVEFALPEDPMDGDIVINEILFNPHSGSPDFVEIFNQGTRYVDLRSWRIARHDDNIEVQAEQLGDQLVLAPRSFRVFTTDRLRLLSDYPRAVSENVVEVELPSLPDDKASVALIDGRDSILEKISYDEQMHSRMIREPEGISLERISMAEGSEDPANWRSATESAGFATPGYANSNSMADMSESTDDFFVSPEIISPRNAEEFTLINYRFDEPGYIVSCRVFDLQGRLVHEIANNVTVGFDGFFRWDGDGADGNAARPGYYLVLLDFFTTEGMMQSRRLRVVVATR